jgi:MFS family permease
MTTSTSVLAAHLTPDLGTEAAARRLLVAQVAASFGLAAGGTSGGLLAVDMTGSEAAGLLPAGALALGAAVAAPVMTGVMTRRGRRAGLAAGYRGALIGALVVLIAVATDLVALLIAGSALLGAGTAGVMLTRYAVADLAPSDARGRAVSRSLFATTAGAVVGPLLLRPATILAKPLSLPGEAGLYIVAVAAFGLGIRLLRRGPDPTVLDVKPVNDGDDAPHRVGEPLPHRSTVASERLALIILATANAVMVSMMATAVVHLRAHGYDLGSIGVMVSIHVAAMFALSPIIGLLCDRIGPVALASVGGGLLAAIGVFGTLSDAAGVMHMGGLMLVLGVAWNVQIVSGSTMLTLAAPGQDERTAEGRAELAMGLAAGLGTLLAAAPLASIGGFRLLSATVTLVSAATAIHLVQSVSTQRRTIQRGRVDEVRSSHRQR